MKELTLNNVKIGSSAVVSRLGSIGPLKRRLIDMGITPGVRIKVKKTAPLGDPLEIELRGYELSIRRSEAGNIFIKSEEKGSESNG